MAPLHHILVLCVGFLTMATAGESRAGSPQPTSAPREAREGKALQENQLGDSNLHPVSWGTRKLGTSRGPKHQLVFGAGERMQGQAKADGGMEASNLK